MNLFFSLIGFTALLFVAFFSKNLREKSEIKPSVRFYKYLFAFIIGVIVILFTINFKIDLTNDDLNSWVNVATYYNNILTPVLFITSIILLNKTLFETREMNSLVKNSDEQSFALDITRNRIKQINDILEKPVNQTLINNGIASFIRFVRVKKSENKLHDFQSSDNTHEFENMRYSDILKFIEEIKVIDVVIAIIIIRDIEFESNIFLNEKFMQSNIVYFIAQNIVHLLESETDKSNKSLGLKAHSRELVALRKLFMNLENTNSEIENDDFRKSLEVEIEVGIDTNCLAALKYINNDYPMRIGC
ncbi:hypothetical protein C1E23_14540 [Pseudoalteromonas phenolica]|uniref:Uncharacterized protein n=1 Tax=Pseudoalteromonas phenolica TaxID=161398 RepID=A0A4Q7IJP4_9GAMM|nr:hypothetical protein [Pseudoalteromonas phenolica]RZQ52364.1 hypothetical protein C1E23_14540 [Pseudoalteromonas phenolica]